MTNRVRSARIRESYEGRIPAVVLGLDLNGLGVVRALGRAGVEVIGVDHSMAHAGRASRYCQAVVGVDPCSPSELMDTLRDLGRRLQGPAVLFPTMDDTVRILSRERRAVPGNLRLALPDAEMVTRLMEKEDLAVLSRQHGWPIPTTAVCHSDSEIAAIAGAFPCPGVMKPGRRDLAARRGVPQKLWSFGSPNEIKSAYRILSQWEKTVILQELVPGPDSAVRFCLFYADATAKPHALFVGRKIRQYPPLYGSTSSAEPIEDERVRLFAERFIRDVSFHGLGSVEMKVHVATGIPLFIEPTVGRTDYQSFLAVVNGVNIPEMAYRDLAGLPPRPVSIPARDPVKYFVAWRDFRSARDQIREGQDSWRGYLGSLRGPRALALLRADDPGPWFYRIHYATTGRAIRICKRSVQALGRFLRTILRPRAPGEPEG